MISGLMLAMCCVLTVARPAPGLLRGLSDIAKVSCSLQLDLGSARVFFQVLEFGRSRESAARSTASVPLAARLMRSAAPRCGLFARCHVIPADRARAGLVRIASGVKRGNLGPEIGFAIKCTALCDLPRQEALAHRAPWHETDAEFLARSAARPGLPVAPRPE